MASQHEGGRRAAGVASQLSGLSLDFKIGFRLMAKHPGITVLAGLAMACAIGICTGTFELVTQLRRPNLRVAAGDRLVAIRIWDGTTSRPRARPPFLHEFVTWRDQFESIQQVGGFRDVDRNLVIPGGSAEPISVAEITASGFQVARAVPLFGRLLLEEDEQAGAPPVAVIGYDLWQTRFGADPDVVGRAVLVGGEEATVVGVMPDGFAFPVNHSMWMPLHIPPPSTSSVARPIVWAFGRLAPGASIETAQAELTTLASRAAIDSPEGAGRLRPRLNPMRRNRTPRAIPPVRPRIPKMAFQSPPPRRR